MSQAIRPDVFMNILQDKAEEAGVKTTEEETALYAMSQTGGWKIFKGIADRAKEELDNINVNAIAQGMPLEEIGRNAVVISLSKGVIEKLINKVVDAVEACEKTDQ